MRARVPAALRPRRSLLPATLFVAALWTVPTHGLIVGILADCPSTTCAPDPAWPVALSAVVGAPATYLVAAGATLALDRAGVTDRHPWLFDPSDAVRNALFGVAGVGTVLLLAAGYRALYTVAGLAAFVVLYYPVLGVAVWFGWLWDALALSGSAPAFAFAGVGLAVGCGVLVAWWVVLARSVAAAVGRLRG